MDAIKHHNEFLTHCNALTLFIQEEGAREQGYVFMHTYDAGKRQIINFENPHGKDATPQVRKHIESFCKEKKLVCLDITKEFNPTGYQAIFHISLPNTLPLMKIHLGVRADQRVFDLTCSRLPE